MFPTGLRPVRSILPRVLFRGLVLACLMSIVPAGPGRAQDVPGPDLRAPSVPILQCGNPVEYPSQKQMHAKLHINQLKGASGFTTPAADKDENGYPVRVSGGPPRSQILYTDPSLAERAPYAGMFRLYGRGTGIFNISRGRILKNMGTLRLPRETVNGKEYWYVDFRYDPRRVDRAMLIIRDLPREGDHMRDLALVHHSHLDAFRRGEIFMPEIVSDLSLFGHEQAAGPRGEPGALRYMQLLQVNALWTQDGETLLTQSDATRERRFVGPDYYSFTRIQNDGGREKRDRLVPTALPVEHVVALANATGTNVWYNLPADILDSRARQIATYVRDNLDPGLIVYWEYGNELWNGAHGYASNSYAGEHGKATFPGIGSQNAVYEWEVYRSMQLFAQIRDIFAETPGRARFMAAFWAMVGSNSDSGKTLENGYAARYFAAERAREMPDIGALPEDIITDMSVGGYFGAPPKQGVQYLMSRLDSPDAQAAAAVRIAEMGVEGDLVLLRSAALKTPERGVSPTRPVSVYGLVEEDIDKGGIDPWTDLPRILRLEGRELQYRGRQSPDRWVTVLEYAEAPQGTISDMVLEARLSGVGRRYYGRLFDGYNQQLRNVVQFRLERHIAFAKEKGLRFHFYEGGPGTSGPAESGEDMRRFMDTYHYGGWVAEVMGTMMEAVGEDLYQMCWYKTHNRYPDDYWGLKRLVGEDPADAPKWRMVQDMVTR